MNDNNVSVDWGSFFALEFLHKFKSVEDLLPMLEKIDF